MPGETPEQRDARVGAENEKARLARDLKLAETEALNALRVLGKDVEQAAEAFIEGAIEGAAGKPAVEQKSGE